MIGQTISHYHIIEKLGEGGMGVVYKAQDLKLDRLVALKFLPPEFTRDPDAKQRFMHEAKAASSLDHPNICNVHEVDETPEGQLFIAMAIYDGASLSKKIEKRPLTIEEALDIATQVAEGLQAAHEKGITHRDIKSSNVIVTERGRAIIMDFGLARSAGATQLTKTGSTLGTIPYMSPEQARGEKVDHRSDIWSLGVVLYEMITGRLPFKSEYNEAIVYSILNENPQPITSLRSGLPMELERIVVKMLQKNAGERYQSMNDLLVDLRALKKTMESGTNIISPPVSHRKPERRTILLVASAVTALLCIGAVVFLLLPSYPSAELNPNMTQRVLDIPFTQIGYPGLSADGNWAAFSGRDTQGKWDIYLMNTSSGEPRRITADSSAGGVSTDVSPDGSTFVYDANVGNASLGIFMNSALGGVQRLLAESAFLPRYQPDSRKVFFMRGLYVPNKSGKLEIWSVKPDGTDERLEFTDSISVLSRTNSFSVSPDGKSVVWLRTFPEGFYQEVFIHNLVTGKERQVTFDKKNIDDVCWTRNDQIIFSSNKNGPANLWMVPADGGVEVQITRGAGPDLGMKISSDGKKLLYYQNQDIGHVWISDLEGRNPKQVTSDDRQAITPALSPDGNSIAVSLLTGDVLNSVLELYLMKRDGSSRQQLTRSNLSAGFPIWSPDGKRLAFSVSQSGYGSSFASGKTFILDMANPGKPVEVGHGSPFWWPDQNQLFVRDSAGTWRYSLNGSGKKEIVNDSLKAIPLPGNRYLLGFSDRPGSEGAWLFAVDMKKTARRLFKGAFQVAPNGKFLLYVKSPGELWKISLPDGKQERLPRNFPGLVRWFSISQDGKEIVYVEQRQAGKLVMIENLFK